MAWALLTDQTTPTPPRTPRPSPLPNSKTPTATLRTPAVSPFSPSSTSARRRECAPAPSGSLRLSRSGPSTPPPPPAPPPTTALPTWTWRIAAGAVCPRRRSGLADPAAGRSGSSWPAAANAVPSPSALPRRTHGLVIPSLRTSASTYYSRPARRLRPPCWPPSRIDSTDSLSIRPRQNDQFDFFLSIFFPEPRKNFYLKLFFLLSAKRPSFSSMVLKGGNFFPSLPFFSRLLSSAIFSFLLLGLVSRQD